MNQALGFIKPHAADHAAAWTRIQALLQSNGIQLQGEIQITGPEIRKAGLIDRHYAVIARVGAADSPAQLDLDAQGAARFQQAFGLAWADALAQGRLYSGVAAGRRFHLSAGPLMELWMAHHPVKLGGGFYAAYFPDQQVYVLNGFYPSIRDLYTADRAQVRCFLMNFDEARLTWRRFRDAVIGATDPAKADPASIRGALFRAGRELNLALDFRDNAIHASASPLEAALEKSVWLADFQPDSDPLFQYLAPRGWSWEDLLRIGRTNPLIPAGDRTLPLIDAVENLDTPAVAERLLALGIPAP